MAGKIVSELIYRLIADEKDLVAGLKAAEKRTEDLAKTFTETGKRLSLGLTTPIIAAGAAAVKLASDVGEAFNAANVVFRDSTSIIEEWGDNAVEQAGLTRAEFFQASAVIGAGLINAGESADVAARQTIELTKRAADLASIFNTDVNDALQALQSGLRGESEPLRRFAVNLNEAAVAAKAVELGLADSEKEVSDYAKSQARLAVILEQTQRFQGDFVNTSDQLANSTRILKAQIKEQAAELGEQLLPIVLDVVTGLRDLISSFNDLNDRQKANILITAGIVAALGPALIGIGNLITALNTAKIAVVALKVAVLANPLLAAGAALAAGIAAVSFALIRSKNIAEEIKDSRSFDISDDLETNKKRLEQFARDVQQAFDNAKNAPEKFRASLREQAKELASQYRQQQQLVANQEEQLFYENEQLKLSQKITQEKEAAAAALAAQNALQEELNKKVEQKYLDARAEVLDILASEKTEYQLIQEQIDRLSATPWATGELENDRLEAIEVLRSKQQEIIKEELDATKAAALEAVNARIAAEDQWAQKVFEQSATRIELIESEKARAIAAAEEAGIETSNIAIYYDNLIKKEQEKNLDEITQKRIAAQRYIYSQLTAIGDQLLQNELDRINQSELSEQDKAREIAKIKRKQALLDRAQSLVSIAQNTAVAITAALPNVFLAGVIGALGAAQAAAVLSQPLPEIPSFAQGTRNFMVPPGFPNDSFPILVQSGERVTVETPQQQAGSGGDAPIFQIGTVIADPAGLRELDALLRKYGTVENLRRG